MSTPASMSSGWCMPRYIRETATIRGIRSAADHTRTSRASTSIVTSAGARSRSTPRWTPPRGPTGSWRPPGALQPFHVGAIAIDEEHGRAVGGRLEHDRREDEAGEQPAPLEGRDDHDGPDERRDHESSGDLRADERQRVEEGVRWSASHSTGRASAEASPSSGRIQVVNASPTRVVAAASTRNRATSPGGRSRPDATDGSSSPIVSAGLHGRASSAGILSPGGGFSASVGRRRKRRLHQRRVHRLRFPPSGRGKPEADDGRTATSRPPSRRTRRRLGGRVRRLALPDADRRPTPSLAAAKAVGREIGHHSRLRRTVKSRLNPRSRRGSR